MFAAFSDSGEFVDQRRRQRAEILAGDPVRFGQQRGIAEGPRTERIELGGKMSVAPDRLREIDRADDLLDRQPVADGNRRSSAGGVHCSNNARVSASTDAGSARYFLYSSSTYPRFNPVNSCQAISL